MEGVPRYPTYSTRRSGLVANTDGPPGAAVSAFWVSWPLPASIAKVMILLSSCRPTYSASAISFLLGFRSCRLLGHLAVTASRPKREDRGSAAEADPTERR